MHEGALVVMGVALDQLAWTYVDISAMGKVVPVHCTVNGSKGEKKSKVFLDL